MDRISTSGRAIIIDVKFFQLYLLNVVLMNEHPRGDTRTMR